MNQYRMRLDELLGKKHNELDDMSTIERFVLTAQKIGFDDQEVARLKRRYQSGLEEAKNEHWTSS